MTKKIILIVTVLTLSLAVIIIWIDSTYGYCPSTYIDAMGVEYCSKGISDYLPKTLVLSGFMLSLSLFVFSLLTYWVKEEVFRAWWNFARWWVLVIVVATLFTSAIDNAQRGSSIGDFSMSIVILVPIYTLFIVTSLVSIVRVYSRARGK